MDNLVTLFIISCPRFKIIHYIYVWCNLVIIPIYSIYTCIFNQDNSLLEIRWQLSNNPSYHIIEKERHSCLPTIKIICRPLSIETGSLLKNSWQHTRAWLVLIIHIFVFSLMKKLFWNNDRNRIFKIKWVINNFMYIGTSKNGGEFWACVQLSLFLPHREEFKF